MSKDVEVKAFHNYFVDSFESGEAATQLATSMFANMATDPKLGRAAALRNAMLAYMNDKGSPLNAYLAFWAPFSINGKGAAR